LRGRQREKRARGKTSFDRVERAGKEKRRRKHCVPGMHLRGRRQKNEEIGPGLRGDDELH